MAEVAQPSAPSGPLHVSVLFKRITAFEFATSATRTIGCVAIFAFPH
jgi:hypothetical protein